MRIHMTVSRMLRTTSVAIAALALSAVVAAAAAGSHGSSASSFASIVAVEQHFVPDVVAQFDGLALRPDGLAFDIGGSPDPNTCQHYQAIARMQGPDGTPYVYVSRAGVIPKFCVDPVGSDDPGDLLVIRMGSREKTSERLRSNRLFRGLGPFGDSRDTVVRTTTFTGGGASWPAYRSSSGWPRYGHPGGMQLVGDVLALALEEPYDGAAGAAVAFLDLSDPTIPRYLSHLELAGAPTSDFSAGTLGVAPVKVGGVCCRYLLIVTGRSNKLVRFYLSDVTADGVTNLKAQGLTWQMVADYTESELEASSCLGADWPTAQGPLSEGHQMLNFVRQGDEDGQLYLLGARNSAPAGVGDDLLNLYRVDLVPGDPAPACPMRMIRETRLTTFPFGPGNEVANFAASAGVYVSPSGELIVYGTDYENKGGQPRNPDGTIDADAPLMATVAEFRHRDMVRSGSPTLRPTAVIDGPFSVDEGSNVALSGVGAPPLTKAWIQLYGETGAGTSSPEGPWLAIDYPDRDADDFDDLAQINAGSSSWAENTSSWRWFAHVGCTVSANNYPTRSPDWPGPGTKLLAGTGSVVELSDLDSIDFDETLEGVTFFHEGEGGVRNHSCDRYYNAAIGLGWDLNGDGTFEITGTSATFDAASLDGPTSATAQARATHPTDTSPLGTGAPVPVPIEVRNVAPRISSAAVTDSLGRDLAGGAHVAIAGLPVRLDVRFTDPGRADTQTGDIDWGDSSADTVFDTFSQATNGAIGELVDTHVYSAPGAQDIVVTITDDDGGATPIEFRVEVLSLEDAIQSVADELTALIGGAANAGIASALRAARDELIGNLGGTPPTNGALDKLQADDAVGAITKLRAAISQLQLAEARGAGDLSALKDLLGLVAEGIATTAYETAKTAAGTPSPGEERALARIAEQILAGHGQLQEGRYLDACDSFRQATSRALDLSR